MLVNNIYGNSNKNIKDPLAVSTVKQQESKVQDEVCAAETVLSSRTKTEAADNKTTTYNKDEIQKKAEGTQTQTAPEKTEEDKTEEEKMENTSELMTKEDYQAISEEGISLEKYNIERLERVLFRIKNQRVEREENLEEQKEQLDDKIQAVRNMVDYKGAAKKIVQKLIESDLPVTEANIAKLANTMEMAASIPELTDKSMNYLIKNNMEPTIENIYKASYSGGCSQSKEVPEEVYHSLEKQMKDIIKNAGMDVNDETTASAKWLLNQQLPVTEDSLWEYQDLVQIRKNFNAEDVLFKAVKAMAAGNAPESASLSTAGRVQNVIDVLNSIGDEAIKEAVHTKQDDLNQISIKDLQKAQQNTEQDSGETNSNSNKQAQAEVPEDRYSELDIKTITVRRQLEEIRLKMTLDAGGQLMKKGFHLETDSLSKVVDGLRELENQYYHNLLKEGSASVNTENVEVLKNSLLGMDELKGMPSYILGSTLASHKIETAEGLLTAGNECRQLLEKANAAYETLMTRPRSDMGDSIQKAFSNVDDILKDMKLETTTANERAVKILGYNGINITEENIQNIKAYDNQVNYMLKNFHPAVAVELIKKGVNPMNTPIEELNQQIDAVKGELGITSEEKYSKYLWKLEKQKAITDDEKKSFIGIYRLLNAVEKSDGAALGSVINADREVTLNNLLTAVRTKKSGGMDTAVDDSFGALKEITYQRESITDQINTSYQSADERKDNADKISDTVHYINHLVKEVLEEIEPEKVQHMGNPQDILNMSLEKLHENLSLGKESSQLEQEYWNEKLEDYKKVTSDAQTAVKFLKDYDIPNTAVNIQAAKDVLDKEYSYFKKMKNLMTKDSEEEETGAGESTLDINQISQDLIDGLTDPKTMKGKYEAMEVQVNRFLDQYYESPVITSQDVNTLQRIHYGMSFLNTLASKESYEIPMELGDSITSVNVTILRNTGETGKVNISLDSPNLGKVSASLSVKENSVKALITCDNREGLNALMNDRDGLEDDFTEHGTRLKQINYGIGNNFSDTNRYTNYNESEEKKTDDETKEKVTTNTLYRLAKTLLVHIKETEQKL